MLNGSVWLLVSILTTCLNYHDSGESPSDGPPGQPQHCQDCYSFQTILNLGSGQMTSSYHHLHSGEEGCNMNLDLLHLGIVLIILFFLDHCHFVYFTSGSIMENKSCQSSSRSTEGLSVGMTEDKWGSLPAG